ncbi:MULTISPECIES: LD-carboxypeptidase [Brevundimonas]|jgi:muramoyltetrapeptide carboxypeptidase|uniref:LD-carboxypeptidase n=1 Tax=Brevundimonas TaxID=41275 RepID=UPI0019079A6D|nr:MULTISPECIES: LD-carboxypeptidase [Brevundimonas]MBK1970432.1 LD-carboxypeptidase [Brevundimonas diminuta]MDA0743110.1 LD-carboxypeptidase [Pseudomonadota bacterium]MDA1321151.1 LD-carboxypeptidase [Pseudomonadota bacterium]MDM8353700.1 LD-carboxypeptidase [Brevundimonas diminuta]
MQTRPFRIGVVNASSRLDPARGEAIRAWAAANWPNGEVELVLHPALFEAHGHFGGDDATRARAFVETANDPDIDAVWFARGGYGACRIAEAVIPELTAHAYVKRYLGYSDAGSLLAALYRAGFPHVAHGPMASDGSRHDVTGLRAVNWLRSGDAASLEPSLLTDPRPAVGFNLTILNELVGTAIEPDLTGHVLMLEEVSEALYRVDRMMFHLTGQASIRRVAGIRLGRVSDVTANDPDFGLTAEEIVRYWCVRSGIAYLGGADIGHDRDNKVVPFGRRG